MDRVPELYIGFLGVLKTGAVAQPLFSAFGEESLLVRLQNAEHLGDHHPEETRAQGPQDPRAASQPASHHHRGCRAKLALQEREVKFEMEKAPRVEDFAVYPTTAESPSVLHYTSGTTGQPKGAQHVHYSIISQYLTSQMGAGPAAR